MRKLERKGLKAILSLSGKPGLYRYVANSRWGIIVEPLEGGARFEVSGLQDVSSLYDIAIYTDDADMPLRKVYAKMAENKDRYLAITSKTSDEEVRAAFKEALPNYDSQRVYLSNMRKAFKWFSLLNAHGLTDFSDYDEESAQ